MRISNTLAGGGGYVIFLFYTSVADSNFVIFITFHDWLLQ